MPVAKLARRVELDFRRRVRDRLPEAPAKLAQEGQAVTAKAPPQPLFAPRTRLAPQATPDGFRFCFLNRAVSMPREEERSPIVDWLAPGSGPVNQLWRMNLHYMEFLEGVDDATWANVVDDWLDRNALPKPGAWRDSWNSYALSLRIVVWLQELTRRNGRLPDDLVARVNASIVSQISFLVSNLETDLGGNHLIKNIKALLWASAFFEGDEPARWREVALKHLARELDRQILADGVHDERSASYHCQVFADLMECRHALGGDPLGGALDAALQRMARAAVDLTHPDGGVALFNDAGLSMAYAPGECLDVYERLFGQRPAPRAVFAYPGAGYYGLRAGGIYLVADCGRIAPDDLPAHGHGDVLSFELSVAGQRFIVDQGVFEYVAGQRRQAARAAASHNTLSLAGTDQADFFGAFRCGRRPNVMVRRYEARADGLLMEGSHDGYAHLPGRPVHVRTFEATPERIVITDRIEGSTDRAARIGFLLHPDVAVKLAGRCALLNHGADQVELSADVNIDVEPAVWWPDMGKESLTNRIVIRHDCQQTTVANLKIDSRNVA